eukprot:scaffold5060_cov123-Isochrysis_galbana.AAC.6
MPNDHSALTPLPHHLPIPFPYSGHFRWGMVQKLRALQQPDVDVGSCLENLGGNVEPYPMSAFTSTPSGRTMDEHSESFCGKWRYLVGLANCPREPRGLPIV